MEVAGQVANTQDEIERLCVTLGIAVDQVEPVETMTQRVSIAFLFAIETAMRAGEICGLMPADVSGRVATLAQTKNGTKRTVSLSTHAAALLELLPEPAEEETIFGVTSKSLDALFRKAKTRAAIDDARFITRATWPSPDSQKS